MISTPIVIFTPCCDPGYPITWGDTGSIGIPYNSYWVYIGGAAISGEGTPLYDSLIPGQCYNITYSTVPFSLPLPTPFPLDVTSFSNSLVYFPGDKTCTAPYCINACPPITPEPTSNRYLQYVPCCPNTGGPTLYYRIPPTNIPIDGVASYIGTISPVPYPTTDVNGNITDSLVQNKCYSITQHTVGVGQPVSDITQYNNLAIAPQDLSGNYIWHSPTTPGQWDSDCQRYIDDCPECNPLCFTLWSCDGSQPLFTTSTDLSAFVIPGVHITVSSVDPLDNIVDLCVFVQNTTQFDCTNAIEVVVTSNSCVCDCICYSIIGQIKSVEWIDCYGVYNSVATPLSPFEICAGAFPLTFPLAPNNPLQIMSNGLCEEVTFFNNETCEDETVFNCEPACYLLEDCLDNTNVIYSNSPSLLGPANLGQVVTIAGHTECWKILIPQECICPINVTILTISDCCEACLPNINYKLTLCEDSTAFTYTSDDLSLYVGKVIRREDCPEECWIVSEIDGNIPTDIPIVVIEDYLNCELCYRKYYLLEDCLNLENDILTYTDLSDYVGKIITLDWCPETCWEVSETIEDDGAGVISDILNSYAECIDCLTNASCICSTIKNYNNISLTYNYLNCQGILQTITLLPGKKSKRLCLIRWYVPEPCDELIVTITSSVGVVSNIILYQNSVNHPGPVIVNNKPTWKDVGNNLYVYYDGTKWILSKNFTPLVLPSVYTTIGFINCNGDCDCPTGTWQQSSSIPNQDVYVTTEYKYTIEYFGNCTNGRCPAVKNKQKVIKPGYKTCACETWKYEEVSCKAAESLYKQVLQLRYGISNCCPEDDERYIVQKELIDLQCIIPPVEETPNCFFGLVLETIYLMEYSDIALLPLEWQNIGLGDPTSACGLGVGCHICNNALFELEADSVSLGESKMNNAGGNITTGSTTSYGTVICGDYDNTPAPLTGGSWAGNISSRYSKIVVDEDTAQALSDATSGGIITISAKCAKELYNCTLPDCSCALGFNGGCHTNVTFLRVTQGNILLYAGGIGGDIEVTIDPCSPIPIPPLPPLVINTIYTTFSAFPPLPPPPIPPCATCTTTGRVPQVGNSVTHNGVVISASGTGTINMTTFSYLGFMCPLPLPGATMSTVWLGGGTMFTLAPFIYTLTFSVPVNNIVIRLYSYNSSNPISPPPIPSFIYPFAESFTFTTNTGSQIPLISSCEYCCGIINANTITAANTSLLCDQWSSGYLTNGNGIFTISNSAPFTTLTVAGPGGLDGTIMDICTDSLIPVPPPVFSYNCVNGNCVFVSGPSGTYPTLAACTNACISPVITYDCTNGNCVLVSGPGGQYPTLLACQNNCGSANTIYTTFDII
jgi:hypothetical protein